MEKQYISQLRVGDRVESCFAVSFKQLAPYSSRSARAGEEFLKLVLQDVTGTLEGRVWDNASGLNGIFDVEDIIYVEGLVTEYNGLQLAINSIQKVSPREVDFSDFVPTTQYDISKLWGNYEEYISSINNPHLDRLFKAIFSSDFKEKFFAAPGGKTIHHAYRGGLLEHTLEVASIADHISQIYSDHINRDILLTGALLHDIGKTMEYDVNSISFQMTDRGRLLGHLVLGRDILMESSAGIADFPCELEDELGHMILSHHGHKEWGSPEPPKTIEAFALYHSDLVSARLNQAISSFSEKHDGRWTKWDPFLERSFFISPYKTPEEFVTPADDND
ncbi:MAG: HD domain-containing protein [Clostridia bacterium]|nr:HD domain-containing protein [Clostridia bacterium]